MKTLQFLSAALFLILALSCSNDSEQNNNQKWLVSKEHYTAGATQATGVYTYNSKGKPLQIKFYDGQNVLLRTETYSYDGNNYLIKWESDKTDPGQNDVRYEIENNAQGRRVLEKYYSNNTLVFTAESTYSTNRISIVSKNANGDFINTMTINTDTKGNYLDWVIDDNNSNTPNVSGVYSNYDNKQPVTRWGYFELLEYEGLPNNLGRLIKKTGLTVTKDFRFEYLYNSDGYVTVIKKYNNLDNTLVATTSFDLIKQ